MMRTLTACVIAFFVGSLPACTGSVGNCDIDPSADCFKGKGGAPSGSGGSGGAAGMSGGAAGMSGGTAGTGGACDCMNPGCPKCTGAQCAMGSDCQSGYCVSGVCCGTACDGVCMGCSSDVTGQTSGTCAPLLPDKTGDACKDQGGCSTSTPGHCQCDDGMNDGDESDVDCGGSCSRKCTNGLACGKDDDCASGSPCVEGLCCATSCDGPCHSCAVPGTNGICVATPGPHPGCDENGQQCNLDGTCKDGLGADCGGGGECWTNLCYNVVGDNKWNNVCGLCFMNDQCPGGVCDGNNRCVHPAGNGAPCVENAMCQGGHCIDGVCCESDCNGACMGCNNHYTYEADGLCKPIHEGYDPHGECNGAGAGSKCSGMPADGSGNSPCGPG